MGAAFLLAIVTASACSVADFTRPEGNGGWGPDRRRDELAARMAAAGADFGTGASDPALAPQAPGGRLDLPTALTLALEQNRRIADAELQVDAARARVWDARGRFLPSTTGSGRYTWYSDAQRVQVAPELSQQLGQQLSFEIRQADFGVLNGTAVLPLDVSGEVRHLLRAAQAGYRGEVARHWATTLEQQARVVIAYFQLLEAQRLRAVTELTIALEREQLENAQRRYDSGRLTKNELLVVQVALRNSEQQLLQRQVVIDETRRRLNDVVGLPINATTELVDVASVPAVPPTDELLRTAHEHNPVIEGFLEEQQRLEAGLTALTRRRLPRFEAGAAVDYSSSDILQPQEFGSGFVGFAVDLGTDTRREYQIVEAKAQVDRNRVALERQLRELEAAVRAVRDSASERLAAMAAAEVAVGQAEENLRIRRQQFDSGRAQSEDVLDAEALLAAQRATLATARYQAHARRAELQQLVGLPLEELWPATSAAASTDPKSVRGFEGSRVPGSGADQARTLEPLDPGTLSRTE